MSKNRVLNFTPQPRVGFQKCFRHMKAHRQTVRRKLFLFTKKACTANFGHPWMSALNSWLFYKIKIYTLTNTHNATKISFTGHFNVDYFRSRVIMCVLVDYFRSRIMLYPRVVFFLNCSIVFYETYFKTWSSKFRCLGPSQHWFSVVQFSMASNLWRCIL